MRPLSTRHYIAFVTRREESALIEIHEHSGNMRLGRMVESYETSSRGAAASARKSMEALERARHGSDR